MKELSKATKTQISYLEALHKASITTIGIERLLELYPNHNMTMEIHGSKSNIDSHLFLQILRGAQRGFWNELVHPLIEKENDAGHFRGTDKKMKKLSQWIIEEAENAHFKRK